MKMNYETASRIAVVGQQAYKDLPAERAMKGTSLTGFRKIVIAEHESCKMKRERLATEIEKAKDELSARLAGERIEQLNREYNAVVAGKKSLLKTYMSRVMDMKRRAVEKFSLKAPSDEDLRLLQVVTLRGWEDLSKAERVALIEKTASSPMFAKAVKKLADAAGESIVLPFDIDEHMKTLDDVERRFEMAIDAIDVEPNNYGNMEFFGSYDNSSFVALITELDGDAASTVPDPTSIIERLNIALERADDAHDSKLKAEIKAFINVHKPDLLTDAEKRADLLTRAEDLIERAESLSPESW